MAEFKEVIENHNRMCKSFNSTVHVCHDESGDRCPLISLSCGDYSLFTKEDFIFFENTVTEWSQQHPIKTNADKFKEVFGLCVHPTIDDCGLLECPDLMNCDTCPNKDFWNKPYKEQTNETKQN